jgi:D-alanyl-D-alanine carboxypeptidase (penicillin-binding protein 5/6)
MTLRAPRAALAALTVLLGACSGSDEAPTPATDAPAVTDGAAGPASAAATTQVPAPPQLAARSYIVLDHDSGRVLAALDPDSRQEPASLTKLMTAYGVFKALAEGRLKLDDMVTISEHAWKQEGSRMFVEVGKQVSVENLILGMIVVSGNDATVALAEKVGGTEAGFAQMMNSYAKQLGMTGSHFSNAPGMPDPEHYITARDAAVLASAMIREFPQYYRWYAQREFTWNGITQQNRNGLLWRDPTVDGVKTGHTESAGYCLITSAKRDGMRLVSVVLGTDSMKSREDASAALLNYGFNFYETRKLYAARDALTTLPVYKGVASTVGLGLKSDAWATIQRGQPGATQVELQVDGPLIAPLTPDTRVGKATIIVDGTAVRSEDLFPVAAVEQAGFFGRLVDSIKLWFA